MSAGIITAEQFFRQSKVRRYAPAERPVRLVGKVPPPESEITDQHVQVAKINHGRWIVECRWCPSAQVGDPDDARFYCPDCENNGLHQWIRVVYPPAKDMGKIIDLLMVRPIINRNWEPSETVKDLKAENVANLETEAS